MEEVDWDQKLQARTVGYDGAKVYTAECLDLERVCDALPPVGLGGLVNAADVSTGFVREALLDPSLVLKAFFRGTLLRTRHLYKRRKVHDIYLGKPQPAHSLTPTLHAAALPQLRKSKGGSRLRHQAHGGPPRKANARAAAQESKDHHRSLQACSTRLRNNC